MVGVERASWMVNLLSVGVELTGGEELNILKSIHDLKKSDEEPTHIL